MRWPATCVGNKNRKRKGIATVNVRSIISCQMIVQMLAFFYAHSTTPKAERRGKRPFNDGFLLDKSEYQESYFGSSYASHYRCRCSKRDGVD